MYPSPRAAVAAMVRWAERRRSPQSTPWPGRPVEVASAADPWRYIRCKPSRNAPRPQDEREDDPIIVAILFARYDTRYYLTRHYIYQQPMSEFRQGMERKRARRARAKFIQELCRRGILSEPIRNCCDNPRGIPCDSPRENCPRNWWFLNDRAELGVSPSPAWG